MMKYLCLLVAAAGFILHSCSCPQQFIIDDDPPPLPLCHVPEKIRLALILGGGGAKGFAHVGVLEEFEQANIPIDLIVGCSAGSLIGALYADCPNAAYVKKLIDPWKSKWFLDINIFKARFGLSQGDSMHRILECSLHAKTFEELKIPLIVVATDLCSAELVTLGGGEIVPAVRASCAIPFVFVPVEVHDRIFVDGGVIDPVPVRVARKLNAEIVVSVDLRCLLPKTFPTNLFSVATRSAEITLLWQSETCIQDSDVVIRPDLGELGTFDDEYHEQMYQAGRRAAREAMPQILELLSSKGYLAENK